jgi:hypothetical protein
MSIFKKKKEFGLIGKTVTFRHDRETIKGVVIATYLDSDLRPAINTYAGSIQNPPMAAFIEEMAIIERVDNTRYLEQFIHVRVRNIATIEKP